MKTNKYIFILLFLFSVLFVDAQLVYNNGAVVQINSGLVVQINGDLENATAGDITNNGNLNITSNITNNSTIDGNGNYNISGDWINNNSFTSGTSSVRLEGANQNIGGTVSTTFNNLELTGSGIKTLQINTNLNGILALNDRELATEGFTMYVLNSNLNAITRTMGFVSSILNGSLSRATLNASAYEFPVGSSIGTLRYRPVYLTPSNAAANIFTVQMVNNDATSDGYDRALIDTTLCATNPDYYHRINRAAGTAAVDMSIYYDEITDGIWGGIAQWNTAPSNLWENMGTANVVSATPLSSTSISGWNDFTTDPYILTIELPTVNLGPDTFFCAGSYVSIDAGVFDSYLWSDGVTTQINDISIADVYFVTVTSQGCSAVDVIKIDEKPNPVAFAGLDTVICEGGTANLTVTGGVSYEWSTTETTPNINVSPVLSTDYIVTVSNNFCSASDTLTVFVNPTPTANAFAGQNASICEGESIQLNASGGTVYTWNNNVSLSDPNINNPYANPNSTTIYVVEVSNGTCSSFDSITVFVYNAPVIDAGVDTTVFISEDALLHATNSNYTYVWTPINGLSNSTIYNPIFNLSDIGEYSYTVEVTDSNGCKASDLIIITVEEKPAGDLIIYNTFTPNNDGINDTWVIDNIDQYPNNIIKVYNRNGHIVFETTNYNNYWDGKYYGNNLPAATYYYVIDLGDGSDIYKGDLTIIR